MNAPLRALPAASLTLLLCALQVGCITTPMGRRGWRALETPHFEILTTYSEAGSLRLGRELEQFRSSSEHIWGRSIPRAARRTRVIAYDGNGADQPFRLPGRADSFLVARPSGDTIVLRTAHGWSEAAPTELRLELARRWFRSARPSAQPPWLVEGLAQVASTSDVRGGRRLRAMDLLLFPVALLKLLEAATQKPNRVNAGLPHFDHLELLRSAHWLPMDRLLTASDLDGWSQGERELFEAQSWLIAHYMSFELNTFAGEEKPLEKIRSELRRGTPPDAAARAALGRHFGRQLPRYAKRDSLDSTVLSVLPPRAGPTPQRPSAVEVMDVLGELALSLELPAEAQGFFGEALEIEPDRPGLLAGLGLALALRDETSGAQALERALEAAPEDSHVLQRGADARRARAAAASEEATRLDHAEQATALYRRALALREDDPALHAGLAEARLLAGDAAGALEALEGPRRALPGDPELQRLMARAELAAEDRDAARIWALRALTYARNPKEIDAAKTLLETIEAQLALH